VIVAVDTKLTLQTAALSAVVLDSAGNVVGGGSGAASNSLPPGRRVVFKLSGGLGDIPVPKASSVLTAIPTWHQPGT
jgi:hypothetical protein